MSTATASRSHVQRTRHSVPSLSIVIPVYNEEEILRSTVERIVSDLRDWGPGRFEVILCENGSKDRTPEIIRGLAVEIPEVKTIAIDRADYGAAMRAGFLIARGDAVVNFDADYFDLDFLKKAIEVDADVVVAAKGILGSTDARVLSRRVVSRCFGWIVRKLLQVKVAETHGMKLFRRTAMLDVVPSVLSTKDLFDTELLVRTEWLGMSISELPIRTQELRHSRSGILRRIPRTMWGLVSLRYRLRSQYAARVRVLPRPVSDPSLDVAV